MSILKHTSILFFTVFLLSIISAKSSYSQSPISVKLPLRLAWNRNTEPDLASYRVYYGTSSRNYSNYIQVAAGSSYPYAELGANRLSTGETYYIALTALDYSQNESAYSAELVVQIEPALSNGTPTSGTVYPGEEQHYYIDVPINQTDFVVTLTGNNDADLYVRYGAPPTTSDSDCSSLQNGSNETCSLSDPNPGRWYIMVRGYTGTSSYQLVASYSSDFETELQNEVPHSATVAPGDEDLYYIEMPAEQADFVITLTGNNDADLYVRYGAPPTTSNSDCSPLLNGSNETCSFSNPASGRWYVMVRGYSGTTNYQVVASYGGGAIQLLNGVLKSGSVENGQEDLYYIYVPANQTRLEVVLTGNNDADLYVRFGEPPITSAWDCRPYLNGSYESCYFDSPATGMWHVMVRGYSSTTDYQIKASYPTSDTPVSILSRPPSVLTDDGTPPTGTIAINGGNTTTDSKLVTLSLSAEDNLSGMGHGAQMVFSNDNMHWSQPEVFAQSKAWTLLPSQGEQTVYAKFCDGAGNWMDEPISDTIELQLNCPKPLQLDALALTSTGTSMAVCSEDKVVDGKTGTGWFSPLRRTPQEEYIVLDLGEDRIINRIDIFSNAFLLLNLFPRDFKVQGSSDNQQWVDLFTVTDYLPPLSRTDSWSFKNTDIRYIKLTVTKARRFFFFFYATYISEIKVYGCTKIETPEKLSANTLTQAETASKQQKPDSKVKAKKQLQPSSVNPGRPGKPIFILNGKP